MSETEVEVMQDADLVYRATAPDALHLREEGEAGPILEGRMMPYGEWAEVRSRVEGHFLERFMPGSLAKTLRERASEIKILFNHGQDFLGKQTIAAFDAFRDEPDGVDYEASLLRGVPDLLVEGLRHGLYGSSVRFRPMPGKWQRVRSPGRSEHNPDGIPEHTIREAYIHEFSVVTFPAYLGATASVRSLTDEIAARQLLREDPVHLLEALANGARAEHEAEPQHSEPEETPEETPEQSRSTRPVRDYLQPEEGDPSWRL